MGPDFIKDVINAFSKVKGEIDKEGGEFDFRYSLLRHLFEGVLKWGRREAEGHRHGACGFCPAGAEAPRQGARAEAGGQGAMVGEAEEAGRGTKTIVS